VRLGFARRFDEEIAALERLYLDRLMASEDANEGLRAFCEKRRPAWRDR
jgi:enoyl-CoA hydratase/carnithine racemase